MHWADSPRLQLSSFAIFVVRDDHRRALVVNKPATKNERLGEGEVTYCRYWQSYITRNRAHSEHNDSIINKLNVPEDEIKRK
jgi:hypothetical protein